MYITAIAMAIRSTVTFLQVSGHPVYRICDFYIKRIQHPDIQSLLICWELEEGGNQGQLVEGMFSGQLTKICRTLKPSTKCPSPIQIVSMYGGKQQCRLPVQQITRGKTKKRTYYQSIAHPQTIVYRRQHESQPSPFSSAPVIPILHTYNRPILRGSLCSTDQRHKFPAWPSATLSGRTDILAGPKITLRERSINPQPSTHYSLVQGRDCKSLCASITSRSTKAPPPTLIYVKEQVTEIWM